MAGDFSEIFEEERSRHSLFEDRSKLSPDYIPERLVHRDEEFRELVTHFRPVLEDGVSRKALVIGSPGVGKTAVVTQFGQELETRAEEGGLDLFRVHVNCRVSQTPHRVAEEVVRELPLQVQVEGFSPDEILEEVAGYLNERGVHLLVTLDELDYFVERNGSDFLYSLIRTCETSDGRDRVSLVATSFSKSFLNSLDEATRSTFLPRTVRLSEYGTRELTDILNQRIDLAFEPGSVRDSSVDLISEIASKSGDARFALELLSHAGMIAGCSDSTEVTPNHVRRAKEELRPEIGRGMLEDLERHKLLYLLALSRHFRSTDVAFAQSNEVESTYRVICEEHGVKPLPKRELELRVREMDSSNLIDARNLSQGEGKVSLLDVSPGAMEDAVQEVLGSPERDHQDGRSD